MHFACKSIFIQIVIAMLKYRKDGVSVIVVLDRRRMKNSGLFPVKIEVVYRRHQRYIPTWVDMSEKEWAKVTESNRCRKKLPEIERAFSRVRKAVDGIVSSGTFSYRKLMLSMETDDIPMVNASLRLMMERLLGAGKVNSYYRCRSSLLNIERFAGKDLRFRDITKQWLQNCEDHWLGEGKSLTTVNIYMNTLKSVLYDVLDTPVSPELLPPKDGDIAQKTEDLVGPYELHDFFLYYMLRFGYEPAKIFRLAKRAFEGDYDGEVIMKWLKTFCRRFFSQQFKRSCLPDGPKVGTVALSPRGDWRMPSDACAAVWMKELDEIEI